MSGYIVCFTKCWACNFGQHNENWHPWVDFEDIEHAKATGQADPSGQRCGCHCCIDAPAPTTNQPGERPDDERSAG